MAIRNRINREARGFLNLFRAKIGGQGPITLREDVQPIIEVGPFLKAGLIRAVKDENSGASPPPNCNIAVPDGEIWDIKAISLSIFADTSIPTEHIAVWKMQLQGLTDSDGNIIDLDLGNVVMDNLSSITRPASGTLVYTPGYPLLLPSKANIQGQFHQDNTASNYTASLNVLYVLLEN